MGREKIVRSGEYDGILVEYDQEHWNHLEYLRKHASAIMEVLQNEKMECLVYGSVARGDVSFKSDIDIVLLHNHSSYRIELLLENAGFPILSKRIVQATPNDIIKAHFELPNNSCLTLPLTPLTQNAEYFYRFGGSLSLPELKEDLRVAGIDKRLILIIPTEKGHKEYSVLEHIEESARKVGVPYDYIMQRIRILSRRDRVGRTGIFVNEMVLPDETVEERLRKIAKKNRFVRKRLLR